MLCRVDQATHHPPKEKEEEEEEVDRAKNIK